MKVLVFQPMAAEHPGILRDFLAKDGIQWGVVELDEGAVIPAFNVQAFGRTAYSLQYHVELTTVSE